MDFFKTTEAESLYKDLENKDTATILNEINQEDHKVADAVHKALPSIKQLVDQIAPRLALGGRIFYVGAGTSGRLGILDASEIPPTFGTDPKLFTGIIAGGEKAIRQAVEHAEDQPDTGWNELIRNHIGIHDTVIGITASGTTPYVVGTLKQANKAGLLTACITSNHGSPASQIAAITIETIVGPEYITGSTRMKSGTAQKMVLNMISTTLMIRSGKVKDNKMICMKASNRKLFQRGIRMLTELLAVDEDTARNLLKKHKTVQAVLDSMKGNNACTHSLKDMTDTHNPQ